MARDPSVYIILCLDTNLDVYYSTTHLFNEKGEIERTRQTHGDAYPMPIDELSECMQWGADQLAEHWQGSFSDYVG